MTTAELIDEVVSRPVNERALIADSLLRSLNPPESENDKAWAELARRRLDEIRCGKVQCIPGDEVFSKISKRFNP